MSSSRVQSSLTGTPGPSSRCAPPRPCSRCQAPAEAAAHPRQVDGDVALGDAERLRDQPAPALRRLRRRPDLELAVLEVRRRVLRLERRVRDERIEVRRLDDLRAPTRARHRRRRPCGVERCGGCFDSVAGFAAKPCAALRRGRAFVPLHLQLSRAVCASHQLSATIATPGIRPCRSVRAAFDDERVLHAGQRLDLVEVGADDLAAEHRALLEHARTACPAP